MNTLDTPEDAAHFERLRQLWIDVQVTHDARLAAELKFDRAKLAHRDALDAFNSAARSRSIGKLASAVGTVQQERKVS